MRRLEAVVDSLLGVIADREAAGAPEDELEALRRAAREAAEAAAGTDESEQDESRTGDLSILNPEISVTGDIVGAWLAPEEGGSEATAVPREFELSLQAALDPYTRTKIFFTREEEVPIAGRNEVLEGSGPDGEEEHGTGIELEEGYLTWVGLPGSLGLKAGKFRQELGLYNRTHTHALLEVERPLAPAAFIGDDGLIQTGASLVLPSVGTGPGTQTVTFEATAASNPLFEGGTGFSYLGRLQSFWDLSPSTYLQFGVNGVTGRNGDLDLSSGLLGVDVSFRWAPPSQSRYRELTLKGEWYWARRDIGEDRSTGDGGYGQASVRWSRRWITGLRADWLDGYGAAPTAFQLVPTVSWWQSEWVRLRLQYNFLKRSGVEADHTVLLQIVWAVGPHRHETY
ncbi:MAG: OprO/OprP family phosphate-selective porin [Gemmatimonadota bacterium]|nr:OprO/OprP family phosphate-selective porin [Gemmatimonadota bacterium]